MSDALLADLRALAEEFARLERSYNQRHPHPYAEGARDAYDSAEAFLRDFIAKHAPEPDASERDELAQVMYQHRTEVGDFIDGITPWGKLPESWREEWRDAADAILANGWRRR